MSKFNKIITVEIRTNKNRTIKVSIVKFKKEGTKSIFFAPEVEGKRITSTMFVRKNGAVDLANQYLKHVS